MNCSQRTSCSHRLGLVSHSSESFNVISDGESALNNSEQELRSVSGQGNASHTSFERWQRENLMGRGDRHRIHFVNVFVHPIFGRSTEGTRFHLLSHETSFCREIFFFSTPQCVSEDFPSDFFSHSSKD